MRVNARQKDVCMHHGTGRHLPMQTESNNALRTRMLQVKVPIGRIICAINKIWKNQFALNTITTWGGAINK